MKKLCNIWAGALLLLSGALFAQQESLFTMYRYHMNVINPAYAGVDKETVLTSTFREQWVGIPQSPVTQAVSFGTHVGKNVGLGLSMVNDKTFIENQTFVGLDFSYKIKVHHVIDLYMGLKAGGNFYNVNTSGLNTYNFQIDPALASLSSFNPNVGVGALLKNEKFFISLSVPRLISTPRAKNEAGYAMAATDRPHMYLSGGYDFDLNHETKSLILKPSVMMRYVMNAPVSIDLNTLLEIEKVFEIGVTYRTDQAFAAMFDVIIDHHLIFGYAYDMSTRPTLASAKGTNEFLLRYKF